MGALNGQVNTDMATLFLDVDLRVRFFTPVVSPLLSVNSSDVGRSLSDLVLMTLDHDILEDARAVLRTAASIEREIASSDGGVWFTRLILPYRGHGEELEGVVITVTDITDRKLAAKALEAAKQEAERANAAKSRFLAAASHDLRQPLQMLKLLHSLIYKSADIDKVREHVVRAEEALMAMSGMLNTLLDINQIEAGAVTAEIVRFPVNALLDTLREEFAYQARAQGLDLRVVPCGLSIDTDPRLFEQMVRNLLSNALKFTRRGKVLMGCRRRRSELSLEIWDTGIGIPGQELQAIFNEYHQVGNAARDRGHGLGLGLSIVQRLGDLLGYHVHVRSHEGRGSVFAIDVALSSGGPMPARDQIDVGSQSTVHRAGTILIVEDDAEVRDLLLICMEADGHRASAFADGAKAMAAVAKQGVKPDLILADYNLPGGIDGLEVAARLQEILHRALPVIILTGDISTKALRAIADSGCVQLNKPVKARALTAVIQGLLAIPVLPKASSVKKLQRLHPAAPAAITGSPVVFVVDDDCGIRAAIRSVLEEEGLTVEDFSTSETFLDGYRPGRDACLLIDAYLPGMNGIELLERLAERSDGLPAVMITGNGDVSMAVRAMKAGACDFIEKPVSHDDLLAGVKRALERGRDTEKRACLKQNAAGHLATLTKRQRQIMDLVLAGHPSKNIAADLGISQRTVENHRAMIMRRTGVKSLPALARLSFVAGSTSDGTAVTSEQSIQP